MSTASWQTDFMKTNQWNGDDLKLIHRVGSQQSIPFCRNLVRPSTLPIQRNPSQFGLVGLANHQALGRVCECGTKNGVALHHRLPSLAQKIWIHTFAKADRDLCVCTRSGWSRLMTVEGRHLHGICGVLPHRFGFRGCGL